MEAKQNNEEDSLKQYFLEALAVCPGECYEDLYISTIEAAGECFQLDFAWNIYQQACTEGFNHNLTILFEMMNAASKCMHLDYIIQAYTFALVLFRDQENEIVEMKHEGLRIQQDKETDHIINMIIFNNIAVKGMARCGLAGLQKAYCIYKNLHKTGQYMDETIYIILITAANLNELPHMAFEVFMDAMQLDAFSKDINIYHEMMWEQQ